MRFTAKGLLAAAFMAIGSTAHAGPCTQENFAGARHIVCTIEPGKADMRLFWKDADGKPYRHFSALADAIAKTGRTLGFALNAGMYETDFSPIGLYVEDGKEMVAAHVATPSATRGPVPNFFKKPNGVFFMKDKSAGILPTARFLKQRPKVRFATQSGPILVMKNRINPIFIAGSSDRTRRSGVGICKDELVRFAISDDAVNFHDFARLFRDHLKCPDALFLDGGNGTGLYEPALGRNDISWHGGFGPMFGLIVTPLKKPI